MTVFVIVYLVDAYRSINMLTPLISWLKCHDPRGWVKHSQLV